MKIRHFAFISILLILTGCNPNNPQPNTPWKFKVTINGVTHRAEGTIVDANSNQANAKTNNPSWMVLLKISSINQLIHIN